MYGQLQYQRYDKAMSIQAIEDVLDEHIYFDGIKQDLQSSYALGPSSLERAISHKGCHLHTLRSNRFDDIKASLYANTKAYYDTELLTSLTYVHGMLLTLPYNSSQAYFDQWLSLTEKMAANSRIVVVNLHTEIDCVDPANGSVNQRLAETDIMIIAADEVMQLQNNTHQQAVMLLLDINV